MIYLDTHIVVWLYAGLVDRFSPALQALINQNELRISPIVGLELQYLAEIQRVTAGADAILADLSQRIGLTLCDRPFAGVVSQALTLAWTRDPFDRLIVAQAALHGDVLISKDQQILANYAHARW
ncbi:MAG: PIN domain-containing protein [Caldilineaceae bacterium]|nr:PIN domain-containing protein [Caldilineaceae bacterium]